MRFRLAKFIDQISCFLGESIYEGLGVGIKLLYTPMVARHRSDTQRLEGNNSFQAEICILILLRRIL